MYMEKKKRMCMEKKKNVYEAGCFTLNLCVYNGGIIFQDGSTKMSYY